ncbi:MAG: hypothetical protein HZB50_05605, partial [Chloroflexi bacterium]|nr:hypothetical protein [Chloroflexota bacterium]
MSKNLSALTLIFILVLNLFLAFPGNVLADGGEDGIEKEVNGIHIKLIFAGPVKVGENQFHIQIVDSMGMPVTNEVEVSAMPVEGMDMATDVPAVGVMTGNSDGMDMGAEAPAAGVMKPNEPVA